MTTTTTTAANLTPGQTVHAPGTDADGLDLTQHRQVQSIRPLIFSDLIIAFADGTTARVGRDRQFEIAETTNPEIQRIVTHLRTTPYASTAEHVLNSTQATVDKAIDLGLIKVAQVKATTYNRRGERFLTAA